MPQTSPVVYCLQNRRPFGVSTLAALLVSLIASPQVRVLHAAEGIGSTLSLPAALEQAVAGNVQLQQERVIIQQTEANIAIAEGQFDFHFASDLTFRRTSFPPLTAMDLQGGYTNNLGLTAAVYRPLESGGRVQIGTRTNAQNTNSRFNCGAIMGVAQNCTVYTSDMNLTLNHPILRGFGSEIVQANLRRQRVQRDQALLNRQTRASNVVRDVVQAYWEMSYASRDLEIRRSAVELAKEQLRVTQAQIDVGRLAPIDLAAVEQAIGERMQDVAVSEQNLTFRTLDLRRLFGMNVDPAMVVFSPQDAPAAPMVEIDIASEMARALDANPQLRALRMGQKLSEIDIQTAENTLKPQLDFQGSFGSTGRRTDVGEAWSDTLAFREFTVAAGLSFDVAIGNREAKGRVRAAQLGLDARKLDAAELDLALREQVFRLASSVRTAGKRVELAKATVGFAQKNLEAEKARFSFGRSTNNEVLRRQQELKNSEIQVIRATVDLLINKSALEATTGDILSGNRITLKGL